MEAHPETSESNGIEQYPQEIFFQELATSWRERRKLHQGFPYLKEQKFFFEIRAMIYSDMRYQRIAVSHVAQNIVRRD